MSRNDLLVLLMSATDGGPLSGVMQYLRTEHHRVMMVECAGLFWILAELLILGSVLAARRHLETEPLPRTIAWTRRDARRDLLWAMGFAALCAAIFVRHYFSPPAYEYLELYARGEIPLSRFQDLYVSRFHIHQILWAGFVTVWVLLEAIIVYHGWRAYCRLREILGGNRARVSCGERP